VGVSSSHFNQSGVATHGSFIFVMLTIEKEPVN